jgi:hypothetical protein
VRSRRISIELDDSVFNGAVKPLQAIFGDRLPRSSSLALDQWFHEVSDAVRRRHALLIGHRFVSVRRSVSAAARRPAPAV